MLGTFDLTNCFYFVTVVSTFDTAYLYFFVINLSEVALLYLIKVLIALIPWVKTWHSHLSLNKSCNNKASRTDIFKNKRRVVEWNEWNKRRSPPFPCCPVNRQCPWKKTLIEKKKKDNSDNRTILWVFLLILILNQSYHQTHIADELTYTHYS